MEEVYIPLELKDTVTAMLSDNYADRLRAEHRQVCIRAIKLSDYLCSNEEMNPYTFSTLRKQLMIMELYQTILEDRAELEGIDLYEWEDK